MAQKTKSGLRPAIVYLPPDLYEKVEQQARELKVSVSYVVRDLVAEAFAWRARSPGTPRP